MLPLHIQRILRKRTMNQKDVETVVLYMLRVGESYRDIWATFHDVPPLVRRHIAHIIREYRRPARSYDVIRRSRQGVRRPRPPPHPDYPVDPRPMQRPRRERRRPRPQADRPNRRPVRTVTPDNETPDPLPMLVRPLTQGQAAFYDDREYFNRRTGPFSSLY